MITGGVQEGIKKDSEGNALAIAEKPRFNEGEDPINHLGVGIVSYFTLVKCMMFIFLVLTLIHIPVIAIYR